MPKTVGYGVKYSHGDDERVKNALNPTIGKNIAEKNTRRLKMGERKNPYATNAGGKISAPKPVDKTAKGVKTVGNDLRTGKK